MFTKRGIINAYGAWQAYYEQDLLSHTSPSTIAWVGSVQSAFLMIVSVISGSLYDAGYFATMIPAGTFFLVFGFMMTSISTKYWQIMLAQGVCVGIGSGFLFLPAVAIIPQYFDKRRSLANGIAAVGSSAGGVLYPIIFHELQGTIGFPWATRVLAFMALATCSVSIAVMRLRFPPQERRILLQLSAFKEPQYVLLCAACFLGFIGFYNLLVYIQPYAIDSGIVDNNIGFYLLAILNGTSSLGRVLPNYIADYTGPMNMLVPSLAASTVLAYCWIAARSTAGILAVTALFGFFSGGFVSLVPISIISVSKHAPNVGARLGMCFGIESIGLLVGTPAGGAIVGRNGSYLGLQIFCATCMGLSTAFFAIVRLLQSGRKFRYKS
jgi:predicted MFS family arabinose efflux permease